MQLNKAIPALLLGLWTLSGCASHKEPATEPADRPIATDIDPQTAEPDYWYAQPASVTVEAADYDKLWHACEESLRSRRFALDRMDYRDGVMSSAPLTSKQFWELWRSDVVGTYDIMEGSVGTLRRTIRFELTRNPAGGCSVAPKVLIERFSSEQQRVTAVSSFRSAINPGQAASESPVSVRVPSHRLWYALRRDPRLEAAVAADLRQQLTRP